MQRRIFSKYRLSVQLAKDKGRYKKTTQRATLCGRGGSEVETEMYFLFKYEAQIQYKERLQNKYRKVPTNKLTSVNSRWCFVNMRSLDGLNESPPNLSGTQRGVSPVIFNGTPNNTSNQTPQKRISKTHACFSKQMIRKQIRREYVAGLEEKLTQHPLTLYPHYKDHMSPELFNKLATVLDPDVCVISSSAFPAPALVEEEEGGNYTEPIPDSKQSRMRT
ncbi:protein FAM47E isoform X2 [Thunnus maccoyii]|uniref:protein FAM47E isoform X2 n=1 Tax=Thunnus maccoyii TaxID=8240 RepID=UPI001C4DC0C1|nr:protein FAM47E isoform X2 [Thunnus maccoyii]